ncbi:hypothetical protein G9A89_017820 [Geosiphon pyriformis]|nr:hypothetical protein G9A89_017820 [Geosiphon pyriformis]
MPEHAHNTDAKFDLRYSRKDVIKLEPYFHTCIDLKVALEISATTMGFESMGRIDVPVNMAEEEIIDKEEIIFTSQPIFIPPYDQYMMRRMLFVPIRTIGTDKLRKSRPTTTYAA